MARCALVTGSSQRIGREIAISLANLGFDIALHYNSSRQQAIQTAGEITATGAQCILFQCDLANRVELESLMGNVAAEFPDLCLLVNNASVFKKSRIIDTGFDLLEMQFNVNFFAPFILTRDFAKFCGTGQVINLLDCKTASNDSLYGAYTLSKKAILEFTRMAAKEFAPNIRVNGIAPGVILPPPGEDEDYLTPLINRVPLAQKGDISQITQTVRFLIENEYITGQIIFVDGGKHL